MQIYLEFHNRFLVGDLLPGLKYTHNQAVRVVQGPNFGKSGCVVSVEATSPEPMYLIELDSSDGDVLVAESDLRPANGDSGVVV